MRWSRLTLPVAALLVAALLASVIAAAPAAAVEAPTDCETAFPTTVTDATGTEVTVEEPPESVVALQASDAQVLYHIGAADRVVGFPVEEATAQLPVGDRTDISDGYETDREAVVDLEPDLVLAANVTFAEDIAHLRSAGLTVYQFHAEDSIETVMADVLRYGALVDECEGARESVDWMADRLTAVEERVADQERPTAYYAMGGGYTVGEETLQHDLLELAGLENVGPSVGATGWDPVSTEAVVDADPEWIVHTGAPGEPPIADVLEGTTAYQADNVVALDGSNASQPGPNVVHAVEALADAVHGNATENGTDAATPEDDGVPGFGVAAVLAALSVALLARTR